MAVLSLYLLTSETSKRRSVPRNPALGWTDHAITGSFVRRQKQPDEAVLALVQDATWSRGGCASGASQFQKGSSGSWQGADLPDLAVTIREKLYFVDKPPDFVVKHVVFFAREYTTCVMFLSTVSIHAITGTSANGAPQIEQVSGDLRRSGDQQNPLWGFGWLRLHTKHRRPGFCEDRRF